MIHPDDLAVAQRDTALPGLRILLDPDAFAAVLKPFLSVPPSQVRAVYVRYKPGMNALVAYEVTIGDTVHTVYAKAHRLQDTAKLAKARDLPVTPTTVDFERVVLDDHGLVISAFPNDAKVRVIARLGQPDTRARLLQRVLPKHPAYWDGTLHTLRYKPERRYVARLDVAGQSVAVLKFFTSTAYQGIRNKQKLFKPSGTLGLAQRIGRSNRHGILAFEWMSGDLMAHSIREERLPPASAAVVGEALATVHRHPLGPLPLQTRDTEQARIHAIADFLHQVCPGLSSLTNEVVTRLGAALQERPLQPCMLHGDFYAKQVLLDDGRAVMLDFDGSALGDPAVDLGNFIAHLERDRLRYGLSGAVLDDVATHLVDGYNRSAARPLGSHELDLFAAYGLLLLAPHPFRFREDAWQEQTAALLARIRCLLTAPGRTRVFAGSGEAPRDAERTGLRQDPAFAGLGTAFDREEAERMLQVAVPTYADAHLCDVQVMRHKSGRRALVAYDWAPAEQPEQSAPSLRMLGKMRAKGLDTRTLRLTETLYAGAFGPQADDGFHVPEPLGAVPAWRMWLQRWVPGSRATDALATEAGPAVAARIAALMHKLHIHGPVTPREHTIADEMAILHQGLDQVVHRYPSWATRIERVREACTRVAADLTPTARTPIQRDCYGDNILVHDGHLYLLDLDLYCMGDPALDVGNCIGHITEYSLRCLGNPETLADREAALSEAFLQRTAAPNRHAIQAYADLTLARHIYISTRIPERHRYTAPLLALCEERLLSTAPRSTYTPAFYLANGVPS